MTGPMLIHCNDQFPQCLFVTCSAIKGLQQQLLELWSEAIGIRADDAVGFMLCLLSATHHGRSPTASSVPAGAYGCTISGAGPTAVAIVDDPAVGERVAAAMSDAFRTAGKLEINTAQVGHPDDILTR